MNEEKFRELLSKNNQDLMQEMNKKFEKNNQNLIQEIDKKFEKNNEYLLQEMDKKLDKRIKESEERQNAKLAYLEYTYGEKISAIFDKIQSIEDGMKKREEENQKYKKIVDRQGDILYSYDIKISKLEDKISSN